MSDLTLGAIQTSFWTQALWLHRPRRGTPGEFAGESSVHFSENCRIRSRWRAWGGGGGAEGIRVPTMAEFLDL